MNGVFRASFSYEFLGWRTWVVCHGLKMQKCSFFASFMTTNAISLSGTVPDTLLALCHARGQTYTVRCLELL